MSPRASSPHSHGPSDIWERAASVRAIASVQGALAARLRGLREGKGLSQEAAAERIGVHAKHLQRLESGDANTTVATLAAVAHAYSVPFASLFQADEPQAPTPFHVIPAETARPFVNCVPLYRLEVAAGGFGSSDAAEATPTPEAWVVPHGKRKPGPGFFVAKVVGESMNRRVPNGAYCLFQRFQGGSRDGRVLLVQHRDIQDPDLGGHVTLKIWRTRNAIGRRRGSQPGAVHLLPDSALPHYRPIVLRNVATEEFTIVGELVELLPGRLS